MKRITLHEAINASESESSPEFLTGIANPHRFLHFTDPTRKEILYAHVKNILGNNAIFSFWRQLTSYETTN